MELELGAKTELFSRLDECLRQRAAEYMEPRGADGLPFIQNIYYLQGLAEVHTYLKTIHEFRPEEVNDLLMFADPLGVAAYCWEANTDKYCMRISDLIRDNNLMEQFAPADLDNEKKPSLREQLHQAQKAIAKELRNLPPEKASRGGDTR